MHIFIREINIIKRKKKLLIAQENWWFNFLNFNRIGFIKKLNLLDTFIYWKKLVYDNYTKI